MKTNLTLAVNTFIQSKQNANAANNIQSIGTDMGGATPAVGLRRGCDQSKHTFNYHSANTYEDLWLRVSRKSVVAVPMEVAPRARSCRVKGQRTFNRMRQPQNTSLHDFLSILSEAVGEKQINFQYRQCIVLSNYLWCRCSQFSTLQQANFIYAPNIDELSFFPCN